MEVSLSIQKLRVEAVIVARKIFMRTIQISLNSNSYYLNFFTILILSLSQNKIHTIEFILPTNDIDNKILYFQTCPPFAAITF